MIEFEGVMLLEANASNVESSVYPVDLIQEEVLAIGATEAEGLSDRPVLQDIAPGAEDEWFLPSLSSVSIGALAAGTVDLFADPQGTEEDIVITGRRPTQELDYWNGSEGGGSSGTGSTGGYSGGSGYAVAVAQHTQDCGSEDGAAVQVAKHVKGELPADVSGPVDPVTTSTGNDWRTVEFGTMIVKNADGSFGALKDTIYSSNLPGEIRIQYNTAAPVQGFWHSHPGTNRSSAQQLEDRYPSIDDWNMLDRIKAGTGAVSNPSLWIMDYLGVTREFKYEERDYFKNLLNEGTRMKNGEGLEGRERGQACE